MSHNKCAQGVVSPKTSGSLGSSRVRNSAVGKICMWTLLDYPVGLQRASYRFIVFIADSENNVVRAFDQRAGRLYAPDAFKPASNETVADVAYSPESDTLFVATRYYQIPMTVVVRSFARTGDGWLVADRNEVVKDINISMMRVLRGRSVLVGFFNTAFVLVCAVQTDRKIKNCTQLTLPEKHWGFDAQLDDSGILLAAALESGSVSLFRVDANGAQKSLSNAPFSGARQPLFCGDTLLVGEAAYGPDKFIDFNGIVSFSIQGVPPAAPAQTRQPKQCNQALVVREWYTLRVRKEKSWISCLQFALIWIVLIK